MQLFITNAIIDGNHTIITEPRIINQLTKILRAKIGYTFDIQIYGESEIKRYRLKISEINKMYINCKFLEIQTRMYEIQNFGMIICMPNNREKLELIIQKLTEIGIQNIILRPSRYSILKEINEKKLERIQKISLEAAEQSKSRNLTKIKFLEEIKDFIKDKKIIIFDQNGKSEYKIDNKENVYAVVGPEGGFDPQDIKTFENQIIQKIKLGENILRTETGAIIGGRILKNQF